MLHVLLHFAAPALVALAGKAGSWGQRYLWLLAGLVVDVDHVLATPIYAPDRCSMGFHPLHTWPALLLYAALLAYRPTRWLGVGLLLHMALDTLDCLGMVGGAAQLGEFLRRPAWIQ
jgi:hypothetical protein